MSNVIEEFVGDYRFLSNPYLHSVWFEGRCYRSTEYAFHAAKTTVEALRAHIQAAPSWRDAKRMGCQVPLRPGWDQCVRYSVMQDLLALKFCIGSNMSSMLLRTGNAVLIEGNVWHDNSLSGATVVVVVYPVNSRG